jgi:polyisoprenoid-binding protein YceI
MPLGLAKLLCACRALALLAACAAAPVAAVEPAADAAPELRTFDSKRSSADFEVKVLWLIGVHGRFGKVHGTVSIDRFHGTLVADARVDVDTITMRSRRYEEWVKSDEFFDVGRYPQIRFLSDSFPLERLRTGGEVRGVLTVRGIDKQLTFQLAPSACPDAIASACPVEASGSIRRSDFGMKSRRGTLSDKVDLGFSIYLEQAIEPGKPR